MTEHLQVPGYGITVSWDGQTLRAKGTNKVAHFALMGQNDVDDAKHINRENTQTENWKGLANATRESFDLPDELSLDRDDFTVTKYKPARALINGELRIRTTSGQTYQLHFRKKHNDGLRLLADALGVS